MQRVEHMTSGRKEDTVPSIGVVDNVGRNAAFVVCCAFPPKLWNKSQILVTQ